MGTEKSRLLVVVMQAPPKPLTILSFTGIVGFVLAVVRSMHDVGLHCLFLRVECVRRCRSQN